MTVATATPSSSTLACHLRVYGLVQGVYYRHSTIQQAQRLGLHGWVRNRSDGSVEALVQGAADAVQTLIAWAHQGPARGARAGQPCRRRRAGHPGPRLCAARDAVKLPDLLLKRELLALAA